MSVVSDSPVQITVPELIQLARYARSLQLKATHLYARKAGQYLSRIKGRGMEFDESRPYQSGDDVRYIDWRVTARTGSTYSKLFREERERPVVIDVDMRAAMFFATHGRFKSVIAAQCAAILAWTAYQQGDRVGAEIFNDLSHREIRPRRGQQSILALLKNLSASTIPKDTDKSRVTILDNPVARLQRIVHPGSLVCLISDFRGLTERSAQRLKQIARSNDLILIHIHDIFERKLPDRGIYHLGHMGRILRVDMGDHEFRQHYLKQFDTRMDILRQLQRHRHITLLQCRTDQNPFDILRQAFGALTSHYCKNA